MPTLFSDFLILIKFDYIVRTGWYNITLLSDKIDPVHLVSRALTKPETSGKRLLSIVAPCVFGFLVAAACCAGLCYPILSRRKRQKVVNDCENVMNEVRRVGTREDGTFSEQNSMEQVFETQEDLQMTERIRSIVQSNAFEGREQALYRIERNARRRARANGLLRSSQGISLPVSIRVLKNKMNAISRGLATTESAHDIHQTLPYANPSEPINAQQQDSNWGRRARSHDIVPLDHEQHSTGLQNSRITHSCHNSVHDTAEQPNLDSVMT